MAIYFSNRLMKSADFIRTTRQYSSAQSLSRAKKSGKAGVVAIGKMHFVWAVPERVAQLYAVSSWDNFLLLPHTLPPAGLSPLSKISKKIKLGEAVILSWAVTNRMDAYWIAGHFFAHEHAAIEIVATETKRLASFTRAPKVRRKRRYL